MQRNKPRESTTARFSQAVRNKLTLDNFSFWGQTHLCCLLSLFCCIMSDGQKVGFTTVLHHQGSLKQ